jgi:ATP-dependent RNA helicase RhlE
VQIGKRSNPAETVTQHIYELPKHLKLPLLSHLLKDDALQMVLVFSRTKHGADKIARKLEQTGVKCATLHANRSQNQRLKALDDFKAGRVRVLVATDIAARGIDVDGISHVINFDFPHVVEDYVHRIGRTGRAQAIGDAISFVSSDEMDDLRRLERFIGRGITRKRAENFDYKASPQSLDQEPDRPERRHQQQRRPQNQHQQRHPGQRRHGDRPKSSQGPNQGGQPHARSGGGGQPQGGRSGGEQPKAAPAKRKSFWGRLTGR